MEHGENPRVHGSEHKGQSVIQSLLSSLRCVLMLCALLFMITYAWPLFGETAVVPGDINRICSYTNFFYNFPSEDFFYYLNDRLLFLEKPEGKILGRGLRNKLLKIVRWHRVIKKSLKRVKNYKNNMAIINVANQEEFEKTKIILNLLGLRIEKTSEGKFRVFQNASAGLSDYHRFTQLNTGTITRQLNKTLHFYFKLQESEIPLPWDYDFLREVTGLNIDSRSFFEMMLKNEQFSLLLGVLYRLSDNEIDYINSMIKTPRFGAWKQIYKNKKFLMGMFVLSEGLRVTENEDGTCQWALPGGTAAESFWRQLAKEYNETFPLSSLEFLHSLATKDEGKLNYLYLFSFFLEPEIQKALFQGENAKKMEKIYHLISLSGKEKLKETQFPAIKSSNFYTLLYSIRIRSQDNQLYIPPERDWSKIITSFVHFKETMKPVVEIPKVLISEKKNPPLYKGGPLSKSGNKYKRKGLYLKIYGGANFLNGGDFSRLIKTNEINNRDLSETSKSPFYKGFGGELGYDFGKVAVALEVESLSKQFNSQVDDNIFYGHWDRTFSAIPVLLNLHFKLMERSFVNAYLFGGGGIYFGKYSEKWKWEYKSYEHSFQTGYEKSTGKKFGFHVGGAFEFNILKRVLFFLQTKFRLVSFKNMYGKGQYSITPLGVTRDYEGDLHYLVLNHSALSGFYIGSDYNRYFASGEKAILKMNGLTLTAGIKFDL